MAHQQAPQAWEFNQEFQELLNQVVAPGSNTRSADALLMLRDTQNVLHDCHIITPYQEQMGWSPFPVHGAVLACASPSLRGMAIEERKKNQHTVQLRFDQAVTENDHMVLHWVFSGLYMQVLPQPTATVPNDVTFRGSSLQFHTQVFFIAALLNIEKDDLSNFAVSGCQNHIDSMMIRLFKAVAPTNNRGNLEWLDAAASIDLGQEGVRQAVQVLELVLQRHVGSQRCSRFAHIIIANIVQYCVSLTHRVQTCQAGDQARLVNYIMSLCANFPRFAFCYHTTFIGASGIRMDAIITARKDKHKERCVHCGNEIARLSVRRTTSQQQAQDYVVVNPLNRGASIVCRHCTENHGRVPWRQ